MCSQCVLMVCINLPENKAKKDLIRMLVQRGYESDPIAAWNKAQEKVCEETLCVYVCIYWRSAKVYALRPKNKIMH